MGLAIAQTPIDSLTLAADTGSLLADAGGYTYFQIPADIAAVAADVAQVAFDGTAIGYAHAAAGLTFESNQAAQLNSCEQTFNGTVVIAPAAGGAGPGMQVSGDSLFYNNVGVGGDLNVVGALNANALNASSLTTAQLTITGATNTNGIVNAGNLTTDALTTTGDAAIGGTLTVAGSLVATGPTSIISSGSNSLVVNTSGATLSSGPNKVAVSATGVQIAGNGAQIEVNNTDAALVNSTNHGVVVSSTATVVTGGTASSTLTLDDSGAQFSQSGTGAPIKVTGVADGTAPYDAVNYHQLSDLRHQMAIGVSADAAMNNIPPLEQGQRVGLGVGLGTYAGTTSVAVAGHYRINPKSVFRVSFGGSNKGGAVAGMGVGVGW